MVIKQLTIPYALLASVLFLVVCNIALFKIGGWSRIVAGASAYAGLWLIYKFTGLTMAEIGLSRSAVRPGMKLAAKILSVYIIGLIVFSVVAGEFLHDPRYDYSLGTALWVVFFVLPLQTVLFEELAFRGVVAAQLNRLANVKYAVVGSSVLFGMWHLITALSLRGNLSGNGLVFPSALIMFFVFVVTMLAGLILATLRYRSNSIVTPIIVHWFINASAIILSVIVQSG